MLLEETSSEMNPVPTLLWKESPEACKKSGNLREIVESKSWDIFSVVKTEFTVVVRKGSEKVLNPLLTNNLGAATSNNLSIHPKQILTKVFSIKEFKK